MFFKIIISFLLLILLIEIIFLLYFLLIDPIKKLNIWIDKILDKYLDGHINIGKYITVYGRNAMHWGVDIHTKKYGYICFNLPIPIDGKIKFRFYLSPNGTPWASTYIITKNKHQKKLSNLRKKAFGHNFNTEKFSDELRFLNNYGKLPKQFLRDDIIDKIINE